ATPRGVMARDDTDHPSTLTDVLPAVAVKVLTPSLNLAPTGMALIVSVARLFLSPSRFLALAPRFNAIPDPSTPPPPTPPDASPGDRPLCRRHRIDRDCLRRGRRRAQLPLRILLCRRNGQSEIRVVERRDGER